MLKSIDTKGVVKVLGLIFSGFLVLLAHMAVSYLIIAGIVAIGLRDFSFGLENLMWFGFLGMQAFIPASLLLAPVRAWFVYTNHAHKNFTRIASFLIAALYCFGVWYECYSANGSGTCWL